MIRRCERIGVEGDGEVLHRAVYIPHTWILVVCRLAPVNFSACSTCAMFASSVLNIEFMYTIYEERSAFHRMCDQVTDSRASKEIFLATKRSILTMVQSPEAIAVATP